MIMRFNSMPFSAAVIPPPPPPAVPPPPPPPPPFTPAAGLVSSGLGLVFPHGEGEGEGEAVGLLPGELANTLATPFPRVACDCLFTTCQVIPGGRRVVVQLG